MSDFPPCPACHSALTYQDRDLFICPECAHEWSIHHTDDVEGLASVKDANGNELVAGDSATLVKDLKVKGSSTVLKMGTKIRIQRIVDGDHNIDCRVDKAGEMMLKSEFVKKAKS